LASIIDRLDEHAQLLGAEGRPGFRVRVEGLSSKLQNPEMASSAGGQDGVTRVLAYFDDAQTRTSIEGFVSNAKTFEGVEAARLMSRQDALELLEDFDTHGRFADAVRVKDLPLAAVLTVQAKNSDVALDLLENNPVIERVFSTPSLSRLPSVRSVVKNYCV
jgi:hypothetical protein